MAEGLRQRVREFTTGGGSFWIADLITHDQPTVQALMWQRYGEYLATFGGHEYRDHVFDYVEHEDTPRSLGFQIDLLRSVGFSNTEVLHKILLLRGIWQDQGGRELTVWMFLSEHSVREIASNASDFHQANLKVSVV